LAFQEAGSGPDLLLFLEGFIPIDTMDDEPHLGAALRRLASFSHAIRFDRRGIGLSDPSGPDSPPTLEQWLDDAEAVLDALGCRQATLLGDRGGALIAAGFAALRPNRVRSLVLINGFAKFLAGPGHPCGEDPAFIANIRDRMLDPNHPDGPFDIIDHLAPTVAHDVRFRQWWDGAGRRGASPATVLSLRNVLEHLDLRELLPGVDVPTLVVDRPEANFPRPGQCRLLAECIPGARHVELPGRDALWFVGETDSLLNEVEAFVTGVRREGQPVADTLTVLFTDIVDSTGRAAALGDHEWTQLFDHYEEIAHRHTTESGGVYVKSTGDGSLATFDGPIRAIRCASAIRADVAEIGLVLRCGLHTGTVERRGHDIAGMAVHVAARLLNLAGIEEILVTGITADLLAGSGIDLRDRGEFTLKGVPGLWRICSVQEQHDNFRPGTAAHLNRAL
jgi:class 3 adenylate cyclase/pimeloyl-ACP methyl ester carboxylesterase